MIEIYISGIIAIVGIITLIWTLLYILENLKYKFIDKRPISKNFKKTIIVSVLILLVAIGVWMHNESAERNELMGEKYNGGYKIDFNTTNVSEITNEIQNSVNDITKIEFSEPSSDGYWAITDEENKLMYIGKFGSSKVGVYTLSG